MKPQTLLFTALAVFAATVNAQTSYPGCLITECGDFLTIGTNCGYDGTADVPTSAQTNCICRAAGVLPAYSSCRNCLLLSPTNTVSYEAWPAGCTAGLSSSGLPSSKPSAAVSASGSGSGSPSSVRTSIGSSGPTSPAPVPSPSASSGRPAGNSSPTNVVGNSLGCQGMACGQGDPAKANTYTISKDTNAAAAARMGWWVMGWGVFAGAVVIGAVGWL